MQSGSGSYRMSVSSESNENVFLVGEFDRFVDEHAEIVCPANEFRYIFGPEAIDLGPCCDSCDENWMEILHNGDGLKFYEGYSYRSQNGIIRTARRVVIPETFDGYSASYLGVVLRKRHPSSVDNAMAAFLCPPFGIITLHKFAFGYNSDVVWPPPIGSRFWVKLDMSATTVRVWRIEKKADKAKFGHGLHRAFFVMPKLYLWQWEKTFNRTGAFSITNYISKCESEKNMPAVPITGKNEEQSSRSFPTNCSDPKGKANKNEANAPANSAAGKLLLEVLNDQHIRDLVIQRHEKAFNSYLNETILMSNI